jgi:hypothetical protein
VAVTTESFLEAYPEFEVVSEQHPALLPAILARAERRISVSWPTETRDDVVELQIAHMLAMSPAGRNAKLSEPGGCSAYEEELKLRKRANALAKLRVV